MRKAYIHVCVTSYCRGYKLSHPIPWGYKYWDLASRLGKYRMWESKIWCVPLDSNPILTSLARPSSRCKRQTCSLIDSTNPRLTVNKKNLSCAPDVCLVWQQERLTVSRDITSTSTWPSFMVVAIRWVSSMVNWLLIGPVAPVLSNLMSLVRQSDMM
jgi:hypothetical protein